MPLTHGNVTLPMPAGWEDHSQLVVVGPVDGGSRPNLVVTREKTAQTAAQCAQRVWAAAKQAVPSLALVDEGEETLGANKGFVREQTFADKNAKVQQLVFFVVKNGALYTAVVTHAAARFEQFRDTAESLLAQLKFN